MTKEETVKKLFSIFIDVQKIEKEYIEVSETDKSEQTKEKYEDSIIEKIKESGIFLQKTWIQSSKNIIGRIAVICEACDFGKIKSITEKKKISDVCYILKIKTNRYNYELRIIKESAPYTPDVNGDWGVNPISIKVL